MSPKPASSTPVIDLVREATAASHARLETRLDIAGRLSDPDRRRGLMGRFYGLYQGIEDAMGAALASVEGLDYDARRKVPALRRDLAVLGVAPEGERLAVPPRLDSVPQALGFQYVLEGSTLGGQVIRRDAQAWGLGLEGLGFFDVYGPETGNRWRSFRLLLEQWCADAADEAARGACGGFDFVEAWLCGEARA